MSTERRDLRVAIATDAQVVQWQAVCISALAAVEGVKVVRWVVSPAEDAGRSLSSGGRSMRRADPVPDALTRLTPQIVSASTEHVDVLLDLSTAGVGVASIGATETWRFRYGRGQLDDVARAALIAYVETPGRSRVVLRREQDGAILREGLLSWWRGDQVDRMLLDSTAWPALVAMDRTDPAIPKHVPRQGEPGASRAPSPRRRWSTRTVEGLPSFVLKVAAIGRRALGVRETLLLHDNWNIGLVDDPIQTTVTSQDMPRITWLPVRPGHFSADPFGVERKGRLHVFFEDFDQAKGVGTIGHTVIGPDGAPSPPTTVVDAGVHASYPFIIEVDDRVFMIPETSAALEVAIYEALDFPTGWHKVATLLPGVPGVDATVVKYGDRWWMFATRADNGPNHNLSIWHAQELLGPWVAHARNPVKTDSRSSRPGGTPFVVDGVLYRPAQDDSGTYGGRLVINRVDVLTPDSFQEVPVRVLEPPAGSPYPDGLHTLSRAGGRTLVDGNVRRVERSALRLTVGRLSRRARPTRGAGGR